MKLHLDLSKYDGDVQKRLNYIAESGLGECLSDKFIQTHTDSKTFNEFSTAIGCDLSKDYVDLENGYFDSAIKAHSKFNSWEDMLNNAVQALVDKK